MKNWYKQAELDKASIRKKCDKMEYDEIKKRIQTIIKYIDDFEDTINNYNPMMVIDFLEVLKNKIAVSFAL